MWRMPIPALISCAGVTGSVVPSYFECEKHFRSYLEREISGSVHVGIIYILLLYIHVIRMEASAHNYYYIIIIHVDIN